MSTYNKYENLFDEIEEAKFNAGLELFIKRVPCSIGPYCFMGADKHNTYIATYRHDDPAHKNEIIVLLDANRKPNRLAVVLRNLSARTEIDAASISHQDDFAELEEKWGKYWS